jgi:DNA-binding transcriptional MerR regulator
MISSKEVMARTGISRATLNNYIALNLIPAPAIRRPEEPGGPTKIGYFPEWVVERVEKIRQLKAAGVRMADVAAHLMDKVEETMAVATEALPDRRYRYMEELAFPAILVNQSWEIIWINKAAEELLFGESILEISSTTSVNVFEFFFTKGLQNRFVNWKEILTAHMRLAKKDLAENFFEYMHREGSDYPLEEIKQMWREAKAVADRPITRQQLVLQPFDGGATQLTLFSASLREGTLLTFTPASMQLDQILDLMMGRVGLVKSLLFAKFPYLTPLSIMAGRLESDLHLRTTLPPSDYFDLINQITLASHQCFKDHGGTPGRSFEEGVVGFFPPALESPQSYLYKALLCAQALQKLIGDLDRRWKYKQVWNNTLRMNIGIHCGDEWLGTIASPLAFEFTVVGDTLMEAIKLSEFSQRGAIWASKKLVENLSPADRERVEFGIRLGVDQERFVTPSIYSPVGELLSQEELEDLQEIGNLTVTEIINVYP